MNGRHRTVRRAVEIKGLHGRVAFDVQRLIECATGARRTWLELSRQFPHGHYLTPELCEVAAYYSNRLSYEEVAGLVERLSGERLLSDQRIEALVIDTAAAVSREWAQECEVPAPEIDPAVDVYAAGTPEVRVYEDGIAVKAQKGGRCSRNRPAMLDPEAAKRVNTEVVLLERRDGSHEYLCEGIDARGATVIPLHRRVRAAMQREYGTPAEPLPVVAISDGAAVIRSSLQAMFDTLPTVILDWYHLDKKTRELMSMIALNKADKERHLAVMLGWLWHGEVERVLDYLRTEVHVRNADKHQELLGYLEKHRHELIDYGARQAAGKPVGSGRMEKGVDQVIGHRQKKKGMAWSAKGSKALAVLKVVELNGRWRQLWFPEEPETRAAA